MTQIKDDAFAYCDELTSITIPGNVTKIESYAFAHCGELASIIIPGSVTQIKSDVFEGCDKLTSINWDGVMYASLDEFLTKFWEKYPNLNDDEDE